MDSQIIATLLCMDSQIIATLLMSSVITDQSVGRGQSNQCYIIKVIYQYYSVY